MKTMKTHIRLAIRATATLALAAAAAGAPFEITRSTIDGGGGLRSTSTGAQFELSGTIGQPDAGTLSGGPFELTGGFWFPIAPTDCNNDGVVNLIDHSSFSECLAGPVGSVQAGCDCYDVNQDGAVDLRDFADAQASFSGS